MTIHENVVLSARGTGSKNHENSYLKIDENVIMNKGNYRGLYLAVFHRHDLRLVYSGFYDTMAIQPK